MVKKQIGLSTCASFEDLKLIFFENPLNTQECRISNRIKSFKNSSPMDQKKFSKFTNLKKPKGTTDTPAGLQEP